MTEQTAGRTVPGLPGLIAGGLVTVGVLLSMFVAEGLLVVAGLGAFGPGILRELNWLRDQDEFQRQAARRAGYHAYLIGGLATVLIVSALRWHETNLEDSSEWIMLILVILWMTWLFSALLAYWGARKTTSGMLTVFGSFWAVFVIASIIGESGNAAELLLGMLMGFIVVAPFFVLAWTARRWPRRTGGALLAVSSLFLLMFTPRWASGSLKLSAVILTGALLLGPLIASGIALLLDEGPSDDPDRDESDEDGASQAVAG